MGATSAFMQRVYSAWSRDAYGDVEFSESNKAHFSKLEEGSWRPVNVYWQQETRNILGFDSCGETILEFQGPKNPIRPYRVNYIQGTFGSLNHANLAFQYESTGSLVSFSLRPYGINESPTYQVMNSPVEKGERDQFSLKDNMYIIEPHEKGIYLRRIYNGELKDEIVIPSHLYYDDVVNQLFNAKTLEDPYSSPPELDHSWKDINPVQALGFTWIPHIDRKTPRSSQEIREDLENS
jgi:hypothetical protein